MGSEHARAQAPQCWSLVRVSTSQPFEGSPSQSEKPGEQVYEQRPPAHSTALFARGAQAEPQAPQCSTEVCVFVSQPFIALMSQSA
ncbi:MAG: hypothetical protein R3A48_18790 [Polyangiales bacterium]